MSNLSQRLRRAVDPGVCLSEVDLLAAAKALERWERPSERQGPCPRCHADIYLDHPHICVAGGQRPLPEYHRPSAFDPVKCLHGVDTRTAWCARCADPAFDAAKQPPGSLYVGLTTGVTPEMANKSYENGFRDGHAAGFRDALRETKQRVARCHGLVGTETEQWFDLVLNSGLMLKDWWRKHAARWLEEKATEQEAANIKYPDHAKCYKTWRDRPQQLRSLAEDVRRVEQPPDNNLCDCQFGNCRGPDTTGKICQAER